MKDRSSNKNNAKLAFGLACLLIFMLALSYASVPIYNIFCKATGFGGYTQRAQNPQDDAVGDNFTLIKFNSDVEHGLPLKFFPEQKEITLKNGQPGLAFYTVENLSDDDIQAIAVYNVAPHRVGKYFNKIECFCFDEQTIKAREKLYMPVTFYIDKKIEKDPYTQSVQSVTLSYTFFKYLK